MNVFVPNSHATSQRSYATESGGKATMCLRNWTVCMLTVQNVKSKLNGGHAYRPIYKIWTEVNIELVSSQIIEMKVRIKFNRLNYLPY